MASGNIEDSSQGIPPLASGVDTSFVSITIDAPRDVVWRVLMDWGSYHEWNPTIRNLYLTNPFKQPLASEEATPRVGSHLVVYPVHIPPSFDPPKLLPAISAFAVITAFDPENYRLAWESISYPSWILSAVRWQALTEIVEDGKKKTRYETVEVLGGFVAYLVKLVLASRLRKGIVAMVEALKKRSEEQAASCSGSCHL